MTLIYQNKSNWLTVTEEESWGTFWDSIYLWDRLGCEDIKCGYYVGLKKQ